MKEQILKLRAENKSYKQIQKILGCSLGTIAYHCGNGQKQKTLDRQRENNQARCLTRKVDRFRKRTESASVLKKHNDNESRAIYDKVDHFKKRGRRHKLSVENCTDNFTYQNILDRFGQVAECYLTGRKVDLKNPKSFHLDHIIPKCRGGSNDLYNLGILCPDANRAKSGMLVNEFVDFCKEVLEHNDYSVELK